MVRKLLCLVVVLGVCVAGAAAAQKDKTDKTGTNSGKKGQEAKITKVDPKKGTVTVEMKGKDGKEHMRTFKLAEDIVYMDSTGKVATVDIFTSGDWVLVYEREGKVHQLKKHEKSGKTGASTEKKK